MTFVLLYCFMFTIIRSDVREQDDEIAPADSNNTAASASSDISNKNRVYRDLDVHLNEY
jgi:hypothetical protein